MELYDTLLAQASHLQVSLSEPEEVLALAKEKLKETTGAVVSNIVKI